MEEFDLFWAQYPRKVSKGDARKAWLQTSTIRPDIQCLLASLEKAKRSVDWHKEDREGNIGAYIPYPASWLRAEGWDNEYEIRLPSVGSRLPEPKPEPTVTAEQKERAREELNQLRDKLRLRSVA
jgi:hypothetical protein